MTQPGATQPAARLAMLTVDCADPRASAAFWSAMLGWDVAAVEDVVTATVHGHDCVVLRLRDGRTTTVPVAVLDAPRQVFVQDLRTHLDAGHGYRRIR